MNQEENLEPQDRQANFTMIPNAALEKMGLYRFQQYEYRTLFILFRKTWGWKKEWDWISLSQLTKLTGIHKSHLSRTLKQLEQRRVILRDESTYRNVVKINETYADWQELPRGVRNHSLPDGVQPVAERGILELPDGVTTIETSTKETSTEIAPPLGSAAPLALSSYVVSSGIRAKNDLKQNVKNVNFTPELKQHLLAAGMYLYCLNAAKIITGFENYEQLDQQLKRCLRVSKTLQGYAPRDIMKAAMHVVLESKGLRYDPQIETIAKKIFLIKDVRLSPHWEKTLDRLMKDFEVVKDRIFTNQSFLITTNKELYASADRTLDKEVVAMENS